MADVLVFDPTEFEILETFDFEEEIQRPEETRFYTLDEQLVDFFEKVMPKRKATKFELKELKRMRDRIKETYEKLIVVTDTDYVIDRSRKSVNTSWIHPVYSGFEYNTYSYAKEWIPLIVDQRKIPNYYEKLLLALPRPYKSVTEGRLLDSSALLVDSEGKGSINGLGNFVMTKTRINDDGTYDILTVDVPNTSDDLKISGFFMESRPFELTNPLMEHPFLKSNKAGYIKTDRSLLDVYPSIPAILEHAVPTTTDPYSEGLKYLKLYDVKLSQIPWVAWKERFPPAEYRDVPIPIKELPLSKENQDKPGDILTKTYSKSWAPGFDSRLWLSLQVDGGQFVSRVLLSDANSVGNQAANPFTAIDYSFPETNPEVCMNLTANFNTFLDSGLYRPIKGGGICLPISTILQEKSAVAYAGRQVWKESTKTDILKDYQRLLKSFQIPIVAEKMPKYEKAERAIQSERRKDVLVILTDPQREPEDKAEAIEKIVRDLSLENRLYFDVPGQFVLCSHTLQVLQGALINDRFGFYAEWTATVEGGRICKFCGERVNRDTIVATKEYDEDGHLTMDYQALEKDTIVQTNDFVNSLSKLKNIFDTENAGEAILFTILTFLQVLPDEQQVIPVLQMIRRLSSALRSRAATSKAIAKENQELIEGVLGIAGAIVLLQTHTPFLIPKRGVGSRPLNLSGFPRDSNKPDECYALTSILILLRRSFESFPALFRGNVATVLRAILKNSKELQTESIRWITIFSDQFKTLFENARERYVIPEEEISKNAIQLPIEKVDNPEYAPGDVLEDESGMSCKSPGLTVSWNTKRLPSVSQSKLQFSSKIQPSPDRSDISPYGIVSRFDTPSDKDIRSRVGLGLPAGFPRLTDFVKTADGASYVSLTSRLISILANTNLPKKDQQRIQSELVWINIQESPSLMRDIAKGLFFELLHIVKASPPMMRATTKALESDLTIRMILLSEDVAKKEDFELRAKERNTLKSALRSMTDTEREITQRLLELGIADFIITNVDRERMAREFGYQEPIEEDVNLIDVNRPEEGYGADRDYVENGDQPVASDGTLLEVDRGMYGDRGVRDYDDYTAQSGFNDEWD